MRDAITMLNRVQFKSFKDNSLIQDYSYFCSMLYSSPLQEDAFLEQTRALEKCIAGLNMTSDFHKELLMLFSVSKVVLNLDAKKYDTAQSLLAKEKTDSKVPDEVATLLFERVQASLQENGEKQALSDLAAIIENLGSWKHLELFKAYQAYLKCEPSFEAQFKCVKTLITHMTPIEQLSNFASNLQNQRYALQFELCLSQNNLNEAKNLLAQPMPKELYSQLSGILFMFLIDQGEQCRRTGSLKTAREELQRLNIFFAMPPSKIIQSYINFLFQLETIQKTRELSAHMKVHQSLETVFRQIDSLHCPIPKSLKGKRVKILLTIARLARETNQLPVALEAFKSVKESEIRVEYIDERLLDQSIIDLKQQLNVH